MLTHAFTAAVVVVATGLFLAIMPGRPVPLDRFAILLAIMALAQVSIGTINEWADRHDDAAGKPWRPLPSGAISPGAALALGVASLIAALALSALIGEALLALTALGLAAGHSYNLALRRTALSFLAYTIALPLVPIWVSVGAGQFDGRLVWLYLVGMPATIQMHLANALPDLDADKQANHLALAQLLGPDRAIRLCWFCAAITPVVVLGSALALRSATVELWAGLAVYLLLLSAAAIVWRRNSRLGLYWTFRLLAPATAAAGIGWVAGITAAAP